jgi:hypothetical protein
MAHTWNGTLIETPTLEGVAAVLPDYETMLISILDVILKRYEGNQDYPFIDTKLSILTGKDYPGASDPECDFKGKSAIYGWIQGRGLEALARHVLWLSTVTFLSEREKGNYRHRVTNLLHDVLRRMEVIRARGGGRLAFLMTPDGRPFDLGLDGRRRYYTLEAGITADADLYYAKGMFSAARLLGRVDKVAEACELFRSIIRSIDRGKHRTDQVSFDPKNRVAPEPGKRVHGWYMDSISGFVVFAEALGEEEWIEGGERFIRYVIDRHLNLGQWPELKSYDFVEAIDAVGRPWRDTNGAVLCDPGHALELIGLAAKFLLVLKAKPSRTPSQDALLARGEEVFPRALVQNFHNGFNEQVGGLCKTFDLIARAPLNSDMPWWNLPETLRSAAELLLLYPAAANRGEMLRIVADCSNAFVKNFVNRACYLMAYQTVDARGRPVDVVPATPDADPGYHTGLSIIDFMMCVRRLAKPAYG